MIYAPLLEAAAYPHPVSEPIQTLQTHISTIYLTGEFAYKVKKPVNLAFSISLRSKNGCFSAKKNYASTVGRRQAYIWKLSLWSTLRPVSRSAKPDRLASTMP
ncbi:MAG: hypothetical protein HC926_04310 [Synechococcaceae cyanobacterium SM2_3_60]|nr:hypothetical protein [Synechococcaceae cyanobacterium SM2_3_60]